MRPMLRSAAGHVSGEPTAVLLQSRSAMARPSSPPFRKSGSSIGARRPFCARNRAPVANGSAGRSRGTAVLILPARKWIDPPGPGCHHPRVDVVSSLPAFVLAVLLISASPGPAMALILRRAALRGWRGAVPTVLGLELGLYVWALFAGAGFATLVAASEVAYLVLRVVGAAVLLYLGLRALRTAWQERRAGGAGEPAALVPVTGRRWWG